MLELEERKIKEKIKTLAAQKKKEAEEEKEAQEKLEAQQKENRPFFSVIVPVHNAKDTIRRLLSSVMAQNFPSMEIIIANDGSTDSTVSRILDYISKPSNNPNSIPVIIIDSPYTVHCAGNTREAGMATAKGEWITFIDHDDEFEPNVLQEVHDTIIANNESHVFCTFHSEYHDKDGTKIPMTIDNGVPLESWLHGKFFNLDNLIKKFDIHFAKDLYYLEDIYFTKKVLSALFKNGLITMPTFKFYDIHTYIWHVYGQNTHTKLAQGKYIHNDYGVALYYSDIVFPFYNEILLSPNASQEAKEAAMMSTIASMRYVFVIKQSLIKTYGRNDPIISVLQQNLDNNIGYLFLSDIPDSEILSILTQKPASKFDTPSKIFEDFTVWYGTMKGRVMKNWAENGMLEDGSIKFLSSYAEVDMKNPRAIPIRNVVPNVRLGNIWDN